MRIVLLVALIGCKGGDDTDGGDGGGGPDDPTPLPGEPFAFDDTEDVREAVEIAYTPVTLALFAELMVAFGASDDATSCPAVIDEGDGAWTIEGGGCVSDDGDGTTTTYDGRIEITGLYVEGDAVSAGDEGAVFVWDAFTATGSEGGSTVIDGEQTLAATTDVSGTLTSAMVMSVTGEDDFGGGAYEFADHVFTTPSADVSGRDITYALSGAVGAPGGVYTIVGTGGNDGENCDSEPFDGALTLDGGGEVTVTFDGETACDGKSPVSGDVQGDIAWEGSYPLGCATGGGAPVGIAALAAALLARRRRPAKAG